MPRQSSDTRAVANAAAVRTFPGPVRPATDEEFRKLMRHSHALFRQVLLCIRFMPIRPQDLRSLRWEGENEVAFEDHCRIIRVNKTLTTGK